MGRLLHIQCLPRKAAIIFAFSIFWIIFFCKSLPAQSWQECNDSVMHYNNINDYSAALKWAEKEVSAAEKEFGKGHENYAFYNYLKIQLPAKWTGEIVWLKDNKPSGTIYEQNNYYDIIISIFDLAGKPEYKNEISENAAKIKEIYLDSESNWKEYHKKAYDFITKDYIIKH